MCACAFRREVAAEVPAMVVAEQRCCVSLGERIARSRYRALLGSGAKEAEQALRPVWEGPRRPGQGVSIESWGPWRAHEDLEVRIGGGKAR